MSILPTDEAIARFKANEERVDIFVNDPLSTGYYTTNEQTPRQVKTLPELADGIVESASLRADLASNTAGKGDALIATKQPFTGAVARTQHDKNQEWVSVLDFGAVGDGATDSSTAFINSQALEECYVPAGSYLYTSATNLDTSKLNFQHNSQLVGGITKTVPILVRDANYQVIGTKHNHVERKLSDIATPITEGDFISPPVSRGLGNNDVDVIAYWYNDFGLEATRASGGALGWLGWYTWEWAHSDNNYDNRVHPTLGWYRGDDPVSLDWICYWLLEAGVNAVVIQNDIDTAVWGQNTSLTHWCYQVFNNVPNFKNLNYIPSMGMGGTLANHTALISDLLTNILPTYKNVHTTNIDGKKYVTLYSYDLATLRTGTYGGTTAFNAFLISLSNNIKSLGYDGICVLGRYASAYTANTDEAKAYHAYLVAHDVYIFDTDYGVFSGNTPGSDNYSSIVSKMEADYDLVKYKRIPNIMTARESKDLTHPSKWENTGSTPELFKKAFQTAVKLAKTNKTIPNMVTIYNVSEWGEGGPSLLPTVGNGFGYLDAIRQSTASCNNTIENAYKKNSNPILITADRSVTYYPFNLRINKSIYSGVSALVKVKGVAFENTSRYAHTSFEYNILISDGYSGVVVNTPSQVNLIAKSSNNYAVDIVITGNIIDTNNVKIGITANSSGAITWASAQVAIECEVISTSDVDLSNLL